MLTLTFVFPLRVSVTRMCSQRGSRAELPAPFFLSPALRACNNRAPSSAVILPSCTSSRIFRRSSAFATGDSSTFILLPLQFYPHVDVMRLSLKQMFFQCRIGRFVIGWVFNSQGTEAVRVAQGVTDQRLFKYAALGWVNQEIEASGTAKARSDPQRRQHVGLVSVGT